MQANTPEEVHKLLSTPTVKISNDDGRGSQETGRGRIVICIECKKATIIPTGTERPQYCVHCDKPLAWEPSKVRMFDKRIEDSYERESKKLKRKNKPGAGRPAKTTADLPVKWKDIILKGAKEGKTDSEIRRDIILCMGTDTKNIERQWYALQERDAEFRRTINTLHEIRKGWWETQGRKAFKRKYFQGKTYEFMMKNLHGYVDRIDHEFGGKSELYVKHENLPTADVIKRLDALSTKLKRISATT